MSKKPNISKEAQVLLKLLRIALGTEPRRYFGEVVEPFPEGIDWKKVVQLSYEHKVSAIAVDGLEASKYDPYKGLDEKQTEELKAVLVPWIKDVENTEWSYCYYVEVLKTLCQIFKDNGLTPIILKGYGLSLNYPRPSHRGTGDIDVFLVDKDGRPAAEEGDRIARDVLGLEIERKHHHSKFSFKGILIENHSDLSNSKWGTDGETAFLANLKVLVSKDIRSFATIPCAYASSATFTILHLIAHIFSHFYSGGVTIRQICDYGLYASNHGNNVDWQYVKQTVEAAGLMDFSRGINGMASRLLGIRVDPFNEDAVMTDHLIYDLFNFRKSDHVGVLNVGLYYRDRWHYQYFKKQSWLTLTCNHIFSFFTRKTVKTK